MAFNFENQVHQFTRVPYGYKNSLSAFMRTLQRVLGGEKNVIICVDDIVLHSPGFNVHVAMLDSAPHKLTSAGFTINSSKCLRENFWVTLPVTSHYVWTHRESKAFLRILYRETRNSLGSS